MDPRPAWSGLGSGPPLCGPFAELQVLLFDLCSGSLSGLVFWTTSALKQVVIPDECPLENASLISLALHLLKDAAQ